jgi:Zn-dependent protease with chaperone function
MTGESMWPSVHAPDVVADDEDPPLPPSVRVTALVQQWIYLVGGCLVTGGTILPWQALTFGSTHFSHDAFGVLFTSMPPWLPTIVSLLGVGMVLASLLRLVDMTRPRAPSRALGSLALVAGLEVWVAHSPLHQGEIGLPVSLLTTSVGYGYWVSAAGAVVAVLTALSMTSNTYGYGRLVHADTLFAQRPSATSVVDGIAFENPSPRDVWSSRTNLRRLAPLVALFICFEIVAIGYAARDTYRVAFIVGAILNTQVVVVLIRSSSVGGPIVVDTRTRRRVATLVTELTMRSQCAIKRVIIREGGTPAGVGVRQKTTTLMLSSATIASLDDSELRSIIAHEVMHVKHGDLVPLRQQASLRWGCAILLGIFVAWKLSDGLLPAALLMCVCFLPGIRLLTFFFGFVNRGRERSADLGGAALPGDTDAMCRGLAGVYAIRREIVTTATGRPPWRWALFPMVLPPSTHPSLASRTKSLRAADPLMRGPR